MSGKNIPEQCPECLHVDGKHRPNCKVKSAWDAAYSPYRRWDCWKSEWRKQMSVLICEKALKCPCADKCTWAVPHVSRNMVCIERTPCDQMMTGAMRGALQIALPEQFDAYNWMDWDRLSNVD